MIFKMVPAKFLSSVLLLISCIFFGCLDHPGKNPTHETPTSGTIHISADETFKPVMDSEVKVFESSFPDAKLIIHYKSEADCFRDLAGDTTRMVIVTRPLNKEEEKFYLDSFHFVPVYGKLAYDAVAVIVNAHAHDSLFTLDEIRDLLEGKTSKDLQAVMDGLTATSTVRYALDSLLRGGALAKSVTAADNSEGVIDYVASNEKAIGFIGMSWIGDQDDPKQQEWLKKIKVAAIRCDSCPDKPYMQPSQENIALKRYPMVRSLYYILKEDFKGVGNNFVNFLQFERGQLIFRRAYLMPARMSFDVRNMQITNN
jgi:phosphate transport system substrate-binding protein